jgi:hypothetical protein
MVKFGSNDPLCQQQRVFIKPESMVPLFQRDLNISTLRALSSAAEPESK